MRSVILFLRGIAFDFLDAAIGFTIGNELGGSLAVSLLTALVMMLLGRALLVGLESATVVSFADRSSGLLARLLSVVAATAFLIVSAVLLSRLVPTGNVVLIASGIASAVFGVGLAFLAIAAVARRLWLLASTLAGLEIVGLGFAVLLAGPMTKVFLGFNASGTEELGIACMLFMVYCAAPMIWIPISAIVRDGLERHVAASDTALEPVPVPNRPRTALGLIGLAVNFFRGAWSGYLGREAWQVRWSIGRRLAWLGALLAALVGGMIALRSGDFLLALLTPVTLPLLYVLLLMVLAFLWPVWALVTAGARWALRRDFRPWFQQA